MKDAWLDTRLTYLKMTCEVNTIGCNKGRFTLSNFDPINIENFCVHDEICWYSHDPVFAYNYFVTSLKNFNNSCFENFMPTSPPTSPNSGGHFVKIFSKIERGKIKDWRFF